MNKPLSLAAHAAAEPFVVAAYIAGPWLFGFSDVDDAKTISIILGVLVLATTLMTRWRMAIARLIPIRVHAMLDYGVAAVAILSPFVFGFSDNGAATRFLI